MSLEREISKARKEIVSDGYDMSLGEIINLYSGGEFIINPEFQRLFRWDPYRKARFIESLFLGIPIPPIFVYQNEDGIWELIDGLQRLSTVLEFSGILRDADDNLMPPSKLSGTKFLPSLADRKWNNTSDESKDGIGMKQQLEIKRARLRVEILKQESDPLAKYELFQRLNTGGATLSPQEVRNCTAVMLNRPFYRWLVDCAKITPFIETTGQTPEAAHKGASIELLLRFFAFRNVPYTHGMDVHEYLDDAMIILAGNKQFNRTTEQTIFEDTFELIYRALKKKAFKRWNGSAFSGMFLMSMFEVVAVGISRNMPALSKMQPTAQANFVVKRSKDLWSNTVFQKNSGAGVRGTTRLINLLPLAEVFFRP